MIIGQLTIYRVLSQFEPTGNHILQSTHRAWTSFSPQNSNSHRPQAPHPQLFSYNLINPTNRISPQPHHTTNTHNQHTTLFQPGTSPPPLHRKQVHPPQQRHYTWCETHQNTTTTRLLNCTEYTKPTLRSQHKICQRLLDPETHPHNPRIFRTIPVTPPNIPRSPQHHTRSHSEQRHTPTPH